MPLTVLPRQRTIRLQVSPDQPQISQTCGLGKRPRVTSSAIGKDWKRRWKLKGGPVLPRANQYSLLGSVWRKRCLSPAYLS